MRTPSFTASSAGVLSILLWLGCGTERDFRDPAAGGAAGAPGMGGKSGNAGAPSTSGGKAGSAGTSGAAGRSPGGAGTSPTSGGSGPNGAGSSGAPGSGGTDFSTSGTGGDGMAMPGGGTGGDGDPVPEECEAGTTEPCGDCGTRTCDAESLTWNACTGDGSQVDCWETEEGEPLPGEMPDDPKGNCSVGKKTCGATGKWLPCAGAVAPEPADSCEEPGDDADCDGEVNEGCACQENETRPCGIDTGACQSGMQTCTNLAWGECAGEVKPLAQDSCAVAGDDSNCNGMENDRCDCTEDEPAKCNDNRSCTTDSCQNGVCINQLDSGFCLISGQCVPHGQLDSTNPCRRCDTAANKNGWTNSPSNTSCDDGLWCNGTDTCNGSGTCVHQFTGNRCTGTGPCDAPTCDEARDTCFRPNTHVCSTMPQYECTSSSCGGDLQSRTMTRYCSGSASGCTGMTQTSGPSPVSDCQSDQICNAGAQRCDPGLGCGTTWCDTATDLCWTTMDAPRVQLAQAASYCSGLTLGGRPAGSWRLPTIDEWIKTARACENGVIKAITVSSDCWINSAGEIFDCTACTAFGGPSATNGCYWQQGMGTCAANDYGYWSSTKRTPTASENFYYTPQSGSVFYLNGTMISLNVRCVTQNPN